jgi:2',3'-cyclic-nucleotide 2'-phosphodiesterase (5'-nucleotidase family)
MLEHGVSLCPTDMTGTPTCAGRFPQISGFKFTFTTLVPTGCTGSLATYHCAPSRILSVQRTDGTEIAADDTVYSIALVDFTLVGGDGYVMLKDGTPPDAFEKDTDTLLNYVTDDLGGAVDPSTFVTGRITLQNF